MKVLICGDREWTNRQSIFNKLKTLQQSLCPEPLILIHGACRGADLLSEKCALELNMEILSFPALWNKYGKRAGPIRNQQMLDEGVPDLVLAFHSSIKTSRGTQDMIARARKHNIPVILYEN